MLPFSPDRLRGAQATGETSAFAAGEVLLARGVPHGHVLQLQSGRVALGVLDGTTLEYRLGAAEGPCWLESSAALLGLPPAMDVVAETPGVVRRVPLAVFRRWLQLLPQPQRTIVQDMALAHRQQAELACSRLAKDAHARCAEWLLRHAEPQAYAAGGAALPAPAGAEPLQVRLREHKRLIAAQMGIAPETFSRVLRHLREQAYISGSGRVVELTDPQGLRSLAGV